MIMRTLENVLCTCSPVHTGSYFDAGWNWFFPAVAHVKGTAGNLDKWTLGYKHIYRPDNEAVTEEVFEWFTFFASLAEANNWLGE